MECILSYSLRDRTSRTHNGISLPLFSRQIAELLQLVHRRYCGRRLPCDACAPIPIVLEAAALTLSVMVLNMPNSCSLRRARKPSTASFSVKHRICQVLRCEISNEHHGGWVERGVLVDAPLHCPLANVADSSARAGIVVLKSTLED